ncbi:hypothetical protein ACRALDRAFT_207920 [Sodiomyces alcalophilus JCM 7366]|uniref:uncharacterized protein n=1 Tax=Sodiomyces alcalophilus JCM 7366 TaxID=591952 RepID=UPI0039B689D8
MTHLLSSVRCLSVLLQRPEDYWAVQRECWNAAFIEKIRAAIKTSAIGHEILRYPGSPLAFGLLLGRFQGENLEQGILLDIAAIVDLWARQGTASQAIRGVPPAHSPRCHTRPMPHSHKR